MSSNTVTNTNNPPFPAELQYLQALAKQRRDEISLLEGRIDREKKVFGSTHIYIDALEATERSLVQLCEYLDSRLESDARAQVLLDNMSLPTVKEMDGEDTTVDRQYRQTFEQVVAGQKNQVNHLFIDHKETRKKVRNQLEALRETLAVHRARKAGSEDSIRTLEHQIKLLQDSNAAVLKRMYPQRRLPKEIWQQVFRRCVDGTFYDFIHDPECTIIQYTALRLSHVCQMWRRMTLSTPEIWTQIPRQCVSQRNSEVVQKRSVGLTPCIWHVSMPLAECRFIRRYEMARGSLLSAPVYISTPKGNKDYGIRLLSISPELHLLNVFPVVPHDSPLHKIPKLTINAMEATMIDIREYLLPHLKEFQVLSGHLEIKDVDQGTVEMSTLQRLSISIHHVKMVQVIDAPNLRTLTIHGDKVDGLTSLFDNPASVEALCKLGAPCTELAFIDWARHLTTSEDACLRLLQKHLNVSSVIFRCSYVNAATIVRRLCGDNDADQGRKPCTPRLEKITFDRCTGVTQDDCDTLSKIVKVVVHI